MTGCRYNKYGIDVGGNDLVRGIFYRTAPGEYRFLPAGNPAGDIRPGISGKRL